MLPIGIGNIGRRLREQMVTFYLSLSGRSGHSNDKPDYGCWRIK